MGLFKTAEEKAAAESQKAAAKAAATEQRARERFLRSPVGLATSARARGDLLLELVLSVGDGGGKALSEIESLGWHLEQAGYAYDVKVTAYGNGTEPVTSIDSMSTLTGVYLFRRT